MDVDNQSEFNGSEKADDFLIVGMGASAGGIQALRDFFQHVPANSGMAYVAILHLSPDHDSKLAEVLQHTTKIPVLQVKEKTRIKPDHVYVIPPNKHLILEDGVIAPIANMQPEDRRAPIDIFFRNLGDHIGPRAVCVVLSGTGANGSMGLKRVKERGGVVYVQNPREAEYNEMARNAIATELVDDILPVAEIPRRIIAYRDGMGAVAIAVEAEVRPEPQQQALREIFTQLRVRTGHDFSNYKRPTLLRRIERRINLRNLPDLPSYVAYLQENPDEATSLLKDLLISVTNFFRDCKAFETLERDVLPGLFTGKTAEHHVRIWVAGCATGEEAYSIAILCAEQTLDVLNAPKVQIFATDIDESAIANAREGLYTLNDAADVSPDRLRRFFTREGDGYRVRREIREMILFANHNFLKDPPFSRLDLVTCRNVLIYLNGTAQERVMETFHFALQPGSFLFLGTSESVDGASDLYATFNRDHHIYRSREVAPRTYPVPESVPAFHFRKNDPLQKPEEKEATTRRMSFGELHQQLLEQYAPPSVIVNEEYEIVHMTDRAGRYFEMTGGEPTQNLLKLIRPEIRLELRSALYRSMQQQTAVEIRNITVIVNDQPQSLDIHVRPVVGEGDTSKGFILIIFKQNEEAPQADAAVMLASDEPVARQLEEELIRLKTQLRASVEQHEFQSEELKASNEELQAMNEELRSAAEELETGKEELQSINEELRTVNQELKVKIDETSLVSNNLQNLINSTEVGTIFLDRSFGIRLYTPAVLDIFNLKQSDYGRPVTDITHKLKYDSLQEDAETVLNKLTVIEHEVATSDNRHFLMRLLPYRTADDRINGVVVTFVDVTKRKEADDALHRAEEKYISQLESDVAARTAEMVEEHRRLKDAQSIGAIGSFEWNPGDEEVAWSDEMFRIFGMEPQSRRITLGFTESLVHPEDADAVMELKQKSFIYPGNFEMQHRIQLLDGSVRYANHRFESIADDKGDIIRIHGTLQDITESKAAEAEMIRLKDKLAQRATDKYLQLFNSLDEGFCIIEVQFDKAGKPYDYLFLEANKAFESQTTLKNVAGKTINELVPGLEQFWFDTYAEVAKTGEPKRFEHQAAPLNAFYEVYAFRIGEPGLHQVAVLFNDISIRKRDESRKAFLQRFSDELRPIANVESIKETGARLLGEYLSANRVAYAEHDSTGEFFDLGEHYADGVPKIMRRYRYADYGPDILSQLRNGIVRVQPDISKDPKLTHAEKSALADFGVGASLSVPLVKNGELMAFLGVNYAQAHQFEEREISLVQDIAERTWAAVERARAEEALRISEERLQKMVNVPQVGVLTFDSLGRMIHANDAFLSMVSYTRKEFEARPFSWRDFTPPEHLDASMDILEQLKKTGVGGPYEKEYFKRDGSKIWMMFVAADLGDGTVVEYALDVSIRKETEKALQLLTEKLEEQVAERTHFITSTNEALPDILFVIDLNSYEIKYINHAFEERLGYTKRKGDGIGRNVLALIYEEDLPRMEAHFEEMKSLPDGEVLEIEYRMRANDGSLHWFRDRNAVFQRDDNGVPVEKIGIAQDMTEQKKREVDLRDLNNSLRHANEQLKQFASIASHDLQEPLRKLRLFSSVLRKSKANFSEAEKDTILKIDKTATRMSDLIREVRQYSTIAYGEKEFMLTDLDKVLKEVLSDLEQLIEDTNAVVRYRDNLPEAEVVPVQINQLFYNLLTNAIKFRRPGAAPEIFITVKMVKSERIKMFPQLKKELSYFELIVSDNGIGFDPQFADQIFQIFERLHSADKYEGTGIGLALCKQIAENHSGYIYGEPNADHGAAFHVLLPVKQ